MAGLPRRRHGQINRLSPSQQRPVGSVHRRSGHDHELPLARLAVPEPGLWHVDALLIARQW